MIVQVVPTLAHSESFFEIGFPVAVAAGMTGLTTLITYIVAMRGLRSAFKNQTIDREHAFEMQQKQQHQDFDLQRERIARDFELQKLQHGNAFELQKLQHKNEFEREQSGAKRQRQENLVLDLIDKYAEFYFLTTEIILNYENDDEKNRRVLEVSRVFQLILLLDQEESRTNRINNFGKTIDQRMSANNHASKSVRYNDAMNEVNRMMTDVRISLRKDWDKLVNE